MQGISYLVLIKWLWYYGCGTAAVALWLWHCGCGTAAVALLVYLAFNSFDQRFIVQTSLAVFISLFPHEISIKTHFLE